MNERPGGCPHGVGCILAACEIARLRAEVERLKLDDKARAKACFEIGEHFTEVQRERDEALAQVMVLVRKVEEYCPEGLIVSENKLLAEARALLDRLQKAEAVVAAARKATSRGQHAMACRINEREDCDCGALPGARMSLNDLRQALAAWEEEK